MWKDPVVDEVRAIRDAYAERFNYDLDAMARDLREKEAQGGRVLIRRLDSEKKSGHNRRRRDPSQPRSRCAR